MARVAVLLGGLVMVMVGGQGAWGDEASTEQGPALFPSIRDGRFGYVDPEGRVVIEPQFDEARNFVEGLAGVSKGGKWGYIDRHGRFVIGPQFDWGHDFSRGQARVGIGAQSGAVDLTGRRVAWTTGENGLEFRAPSRSLQAAFTRLRPP